jgi:hypothetical protein
MPSGPHINFDVVLRTFNEGRMIAGGRRQVRERGHADANHGRGAQGARTMRVKHSPEAGGAELDAPERIMLFCLASGTTLIKAADNRATMRSRLVVGRLIERDRPRFVITDLRRPS